MFNIVGFGLVIRQTGAELIN